MGRRNFTDLPVFSGFWPNSERKSRIWSAISLLSVNAPAAARACLDLHHPAEDCREIDREGAAGHGNRDHVRGAAMIVATIAWIAIVVAGECARAPPCSSFSPRPGQRRLADAGGSCGDDPGPRRLWPLANGGARGERHRRDRADRRSGVGHPAGRNVDLPARNGLQPRGHAGGGSAGDRRGVWRVGRPVRRHPADAAISTRRPCSGPPTATGRAGHPPSTTRGHTSPARPQDRH